MTDVKVGSKVIVAKKVDADYWVSGMNKTVCNGDIDTVVEIINDVVVLEISPFVYPEESLQVVYPKFEVGQRIKLVNEEAALNYGCIADFLGEVCFVNEMRYNHDCGWVMYKVDGDPYFWPEYCLEAHTGVYNGGPHVVLDVAGTIENSGGIQDEVQTKAQGDQWDESVRGKKMSDNKGKVIYKYQMPVKERFSMRLPQGAEIIRVADQDGMFWMWAVVNTNSPDETRNFVAVKCGGNVPENRTLNYIGMCAIFVQQELALYIFEDVTDDTPIDYSKLSGID